MPRPAPLAVLEHGTPEERAPLVRALLRQSAELARHKFASNVLNRLPPVAAEEAAAADDEEAPAPPAIATPTAPTAEEVAPAAS